MYEIITYTFDSPPSRRCLDKISAVTSETKRPMSSRKRSGNLCFRGESSFWVEPKYSTILLTISSKKNLFVSAAIDYIWLISMLHWITYHAFENTTSRDAFVDMAHRRAISSWRSLRWLGQAVDVKSFPLFALLALSTPFRQLLISASNPTFSTFRWTSGWLILLLCFRCGGNERGRCWGGQ